MIMISQVLYGEPWTWLSPVLLVLLLAAWKGAYHFYGTVTEWSVSVIDLTLLIQHLICSRISLAIKAQKLFVMI